MARRKGDLREAITCKERALLLAGQVDGWTMPALTQSDASNQRQHPPPIYGSPPFGCVSSSPIGRFALLGSRHCHRQRNCASRTTYTDYLVHISQNLAANVFTASLLVVEDTRRCCLVTRVSFRSRARLVNRTHQNDDAETTGGQQQVDPRLNLRHLHVESRRDDARLV